MDRIIRLVIFAVSLLTVILQVVGNKRGAAIAGPVQLIRREANFALRALTAGARNLCQQQLRLPSSTDRQLQLPSCLSAWLRSNRWGCPASWPGALRLLVVSFSSRPAVPSRLGEMGHGRSLAAYVSPVKLCSCSWPTKDAGTRTLPFLDSVTATMVNLQKLHGQIGWRIPAECIEE